MKAYTETLMAHNGRTQELLEYLNNLPANRFTKLLNNIGDAYRAAAYIENPRTRDTQISLLRSIEDQSQPFYKPLERTSRVVSLNESLLYLKRDVRKALCKGWYEVDLKSAQLAIISTIWDIPSVRTMLTQTTGVWDYFADYFQVYGNTKEIKDAVKRPLYAVVYGMSKDNTRKFADRMLADAGLKNGGELFLVSELVQTLFAYREDMVKRVLSDKGVKDAFGNWISLQGRTARSLLAQQAQSYELQLLWPIVEQARQTNDFVITAFQHDGLSLDITRRADSWLERLRVMVQNQAEIYNIPTALEVEVL